MVAWLEGAVVEPMMPLEGIRPAVVALPVGPLLLLLLELPPLPDFSRVTRRLFFRRDAPLTRLTRRFLRQRLALCDIRRTSVELTSLWTSEF